MILPLASIITAIVNFFIGGGVFMLLLLATSIVAVTVIIYRGMALREKKVLPPPISEEIERMKPGDSLQTLKALIKKNPSALANVADTLLRHSDWSRSEAIEAVQTRARHEVARLEKGLVILEIATGISPLLGLLGTLSGLVSIFSSIGADPVAVARGIAEALNTTIAGLGVSVPCLIFFNFFQRRTEVMAIEMESMVSDLLTKCFPHGSNGN